MLNHSRRAMAAWLAGVLGAPAAMRVLAEPTTRSVGFPTRPITLVVPFPAGGGTDVGARILAQALSQAWGQTVLVENRSGAAGLVGAEFVSRAKPDGYTLLVGNVGTQSINPTLYSSMPYDPDRAFMPVSLVAQLPMVLVVSPGIEARTVGQLVALARAHPAALNYGSSGPGGAPHIVAEMFKQSTGTFIVHVPYRGGAPAIADLIARRIDLAFISVLEASARIRSGELRALAVTSADRVAAIPMVPTLSETVAPGFHFLSWFGLLAPQGTRPELVDRLSADIRSALLADETRARMLEIGGLPVASAPAQFAKLIADERKRYAVLIRERQIRVE